MASDPRVLIDPGYPPEWERPAYCAGGTGGGSHAISAAVEELRLGGYITTSQTMPVTPHSGDQEMKIRQLEISKEILMLRNNELTRDKLDMLQTQCAIIGHNFGDRYDQNCRCVFCGRRQRD